MLLVPISLVLLLPRLLFECLASFVNPGTLKACFVLVLTFVLLLLLWPWGFLWLFAVAVAVAAVVVLVAAKMPQRDDSGSLQQP